MSDAPYRRAAFINAIAEEGTKQEAVQWLQATWNERCELADALEALQAENARLREALVDATAHLAGATSAYKTFARRARRFGQADIDALYGTRLRDFEKATERARAALGDDT